MMKKCLHNQQLPIFLLDAFGINYCMFLTSNSQQELLNNSYFINFAKICLIKTLPGNGLDTNYMPLYYAKNEFNVYNGIIKEQN